MSVTSEDNLPKIIEKIRKRAEQFMYGVGSIGATMSMSYAPLEWGDLRSSQEFDTGHDAVSYWAKVSFGNGVDGDYPARLENWTGWKPRPPSEKEGPAWNPDARHHYLKYGFEGPESQTQINALKETLKI